MGRTSTITSLKLKTGDVLFVTPKAGSRFITADEEDHAGNGHMSTSGSSASLASLNIEEDPVDIELSKMDGMIAQKKTSRCNHACGSGQACIYCTPKDPFDSEYLKENGIKFMSFHAYLRKLSRDMSKGKFAQIDDINLRIKPGCAKKCNWPKSICSACQPPALTLKRQTYRHVDHIEFENPGLVDDFLAYWRNTGNQRAGFLYGRYERFDRAPLGIKAVVVDIYEPPQECS